MEISNPIICPSLFKNRRLPCITARLKMTSEKRKSIVVIKIVIGVFGFTAFIMTKRKVGLFESGGIKPVSNIREFVIVDFEELKKFTIMEAIKNTLNSGGC